MLRVQLDRFGRVGDHVHAEPLGEETLELLEALLDRLAHGHGVGTALLDDAKAEYITLENYDPHPALKGELTVAGGFDEKDRAAYAKGK